MTDQELKIELANMLPDKLIFVDAPDCEGFFWSPADGSKINEEWLDGLLRPVLDTEWLHVCWLVEQGLSCEEGQRFAMRLIEDTTAINTPHSFNWQQRAEALCKVKSSTQTKP